MANQIIEFIRPNKSVPWGFSIQGGKEFGCPLSVLKVTNNSIADRLGVITGDFIIKINNQSTDIMTHQQAIIQIQNLKVSLEIKRAKTDNEILSFPPPPAIDVGDFNSSCRISTSLGELPLPPPVTVKPPVTSFIPPSTLNQYPPAKERFSDVQPYIISKPKEQFPERISLSTNKFENTETKKSKDVPSVVLDTKNIEVFKQRLGEENNKSQELSANLGKFIKNQQNETKEKSVPQISHETDTNICFACKANVTGPYIKANNKTYCSNHFKCSFCAQPIKTNQFIETKEGILYCMEDYENNIAPRCARCHKSVVEQQIVALSKCWHPYCFTCDHCKKPIAEGEFHVGENNTVYCQKDFKELYELKCTACHFPIESGDKYQVVAGKNYHVGCYKR